MQRVTAALLSATIVIMTGATLGTDAQTRRDRFRMRGETDTEQTPSVDARGGELPAPRTIEAPTGFDNETNGFLRQGPPFETIDEDNVVPLRSFNDNRFIFEEVEVVADGLGPIYNAQSCGECHQNVATGGASQIAEHRTAGSWATSSSSRSAVRSCIRARPTRTSWSPSTTKTPSGHSVSRRTPSVPATSKRSPTRRCCGFARNSLRPCAAPSHSRPCSRPRGGRASDGSAGRTSIRVSCRSPRTRISTRWASRARYSRPRTPRAAATSVLSTPCRSGGRRRRHRGVRGFHACDEGTVTRPDRREVLAGETIFKNIGCATCHVSTLVTSPPGTRINGGKFTVPEALGNKTIHPYSDFLLHDIGTGDGIPVQPTPEFAWTAPQIRTAPLWALRTRNRLMHDGLTFTEREAIERHAGQAAPVTARFRGLSAADQELLLRFLSSL